jgi:hypothetical protein
LEKVSPATATVNRSEEEAGVMGGIEMFVRWWYLNGYPPKMKAKSRGSLSGPAREAGPVLSKARKLLEFSRSIRS